MYGIWLMPGVLGALVIRKRGAAIYTELVAAIVSALLGTAWGLSVVAYGLLEGGAAEIVFAFALYRSWRLHTAIVAGAVAGAAAALLDIVFYYEAWSGAWQLTYTAVLVASSALIAGLGSWLLVRALARTGVLAPFGSGRDQAGSDQARAVTRPRSSGRRSGAGAGATAGARRGRCAAWTCTSSPASGCCCSARPAPARAPCSPRWPGCSTRAAASRRVRCCSTGSRRRGRARVPGW